ncbi:MAG: protoheme IX farnesyltransferase [Planctomycetes bacterium]|nr:protoheme IX farnesyltransferase [Planctomycetota bacterium]
MSPTTEALASTPSFCGPLPVRGRAASARQVLIDYLALTKPRLSLLVVATTAMGFFLATKGAFDPALLASVLLGTALAAGGASALNMFLEQDVDALMQRTRRRPLPAGRLQPGEVFVLGSLMCLAGVLQLAVMVNALTSFLGLLTMTTYLFAYTPLKRKTSLCTVVGAVPGAIPPLMGWAAVRDRLDLEAWILFAILFLWQLPHFLAIAWRWRRDYARAGCPMLPVDDPQGHSTARQVVLQSLGLVLVSLSPTLFGLSGGTYFFCALGLGAAFLLFSILFAIARSDRCARNLFLASLAYLPLLFLSLVLDGIGRPF